MFQDLLSGVGFAHVPDVNMDGAGLFDVNGACIFDACGNGASAGIDVNSAGWDAAMDSGSVGLVDGASPGLDGAGTSAVGMMMSPPKCLCTSATSARMGDTIIIKHGHGLSTYQRHDVMFACQGGVFIKYGRNTVALHLRDYKIT